MQVKMDKGKKENKGKKLKIRDSYLQLKKLGVKNKVMQKKEGKKKNMNGDVEMMEVTETQKKMKKNNGKKQNVKETVAVGKKGGNEVNEKEIVGSESVIISESENKKGKKNSVNVLTAEKMQNVNKNEEPKDKVDKNEGLKVNKKKGKRNKKQDSKENIKDSVKKTEGGIGEQTKTRKGKRKVTAVKKNQENEENGDHVKAGKRNREPEDNEKTQSVPQKKMKDFFQRDKCTLLISFPESLVVKKQSQVKAIVGISVVNIRFPNVPRRLNKGFCYAEFKSEKEAKRIKKIIEKKEVNGEPFHVEYLGEKSQVQESQPSKVVDPLRLYVGRLPNWIKEDKLQALFPNSLEIKYSKGKKKLKHGHAFISFKTEEEAKSVLQASEGLKVGNSEVLIMFANSKGKPKKEKDDSDLPTPAKKLKTEDVEMAGDDTE